MFYNRIAMSKNHIIYLIIIIIIARRAEIFYNKLGIKL